MVQTPRLLPLLWSWPVPDERVGCCETHRLIEEAKFVNPDKFVVSFVIFQKSLVPQIEMP